MIHTLRYNLHTLFAWWWGELKGSFPRSIQRRLSLEPWRLHIWPAENSRSRLHVGSVSDEEGATIAGFPVGDNSNKFAIELERWCESVKLCPVEANLYFPENLTVTPAVELSIEDATNLPRAISTEIERHTPFAISQVYHWFRVTGSNEGLDAIRVQVCVVRKSDVDAATKLIRSAGLRSVRVFSERDAILHGEEALPLATFIAPTKHFNFLLAITTVIVLALSVAAMIVPLEQSRDLHLEAGATISDLKKRNQSLAAEIAASERKSSSYIHVLEQKNYTPSALAVLAELTRALPDHSWLVQAQFGNGRILLSGYSRNTTNLVRELEKTQLFHRVEFSAPITPDDRLQADRFYVNAAYGDGDLQ